MNVSILNVLRLGAQSFINEQGHNFLFNNSALRSPVVATDETTAIQWTKDPRLPSPQTKLILEGEVNTIRQTIAGNYNAGAQITLTPNKINDRTQTAIQSVNVDDIRYGVADGGNVLLFILAQGAMSLQKWQFNSTTLVALAETINGTTSNQDFSIIWGSCTTSTQPVTYRTNQAGTLILQAFNGDGFVPIAQQAVTAGTATITFSFQTGDVISGSLMQVSLLVGSQYHTLAQKTFSCTGGSGSGSGGTGDCNMYAYFDGAGYDNTEKTLNWGRSCTTGYVLQIANDNLFADIETDIETQVQIWPVDYLTNGTYYARVRNIAGQTRFSPTLTFTKS